MADYYTIKPLEWKPGELPGSEVAYSVVGDFTAMEDEWRFNEPNQYVGRDTGGEASSVEDAKAACEAHHQMLVRTLLLPVKLVECP